VAAANTLWQERNSTGHKDLYFGNAIAPIKGEDQAVDRETETAQTMMQGESLATLRAGANASSIDSFLETPG
jgi:hypothetical protein